MNAIWISLKGNVKCGSKITDVARLPAEKMAKRKSSSSLDETKPHNEVDRNSYRFRELGMGEPSRNVIEMIVGGNPKKIKRVVKVNNPADVVAKFENYREKVMTSSNQHPRIIVDGNEWLKFYGTTMSCCSRNTRVSELCIHPGCRVCRIIQSGFNTWYNKIHGIRLNSKSNAMSEDVGVAAKNAKKAVIICRTIAAGVEGVGDTIIVPNPSALLPCFIVLFG